MLKEDIIKQIVWYIPFKKLRNSIRELLLFFIKNINLNEEYHLETKKLINENTKKTEQIIQNYFTRIKVLQDKIYNMENIILKKYSNETMIYNVNLLGEPLYFYDTIASGTVTYVANEINGEEYKNIFNIDFKEGDIVIDIGANVGMISILLAKKFPFLKIYSFEPLPMNYNNFIKNIELNNIDKNIIKPFNLAITKDSRDVSMFIGLLNQGGSFIIDNPSTFNISVNIKSETLDNIIKNNDINKIKLLKIDCEGSEYEILYNTNKNNLLKIDNIFGEFHSKNNLYNPQELIDYLKNYIKNIDINII